MKGSELEELRVALGYSLEELSRILKRSRIAPLMRGKSRQALHRMEKLADEEVEPPEFVEWMLALEPLPEARRGYEKYLARKAAREAQAVLPPPAPAQVAVPEPSPAPQAPPPAPVVTSRDATPPPAEIPMLRWLTNAIALLAVCMALSFLMQLVHVFAIRSSGHPAAEGIPLADLYLGEKTARRVVPSAPFKGQKRGPCRSAAAQVLINGGCWYGGRSAPCAPEEFEHENKCYQPVLENPAKPISMDPFDGGTPDPLP